MSSVLGRLGGGNDFDRVRRQGKRWRGQRLWLSLYIIGSGGKRVGIVVSKKVSKKAVVRNKLRRRIREALASVVQKYPDVSANIVITALPEAATATYGELLDEITTTLAKLLETRPEGK